MKFQLDELCTAKNDSEIRNMLYDLPKDLAETYARIIRRIPDRDRGISKKMIASTFKWVLCARRPLLLDELKEAITIEVDDKNLKRDRIMSGDGARLIAACGNLLTLERGYNRVSLAHHTVLQYLSDWSTTTFLHIHMTDAEEEVAHLLFTYLTFSDFENQITTYEKKHINGKEIADGVLSSLPYSRSLQLLRKKMPNFRGDTVQETDHFVDLSSYNLRGLSNEVHDQYKFLSYAVEFWLQHAKVLSDSSISLPKLRRLCTQPPRSFKLLPWSEMAPADIPSNVAENARSEWSDYARLLPWALEERHVPLLTSAGELFGQKISLSKDISHLASPEALLTRAYASNDSKMTKFLWKTMDEVCFAKVLFLCASHGDTVALDFLRARLRLTGADLKMALTLALQVKQDDTYAAIWQSALYFLLDDGEVPQALMEVIHNDVPKVMRPLDDDWYRLVPDGSLRGLATLKRLLHHLANCTEGFVPFHHDTARVRLGAALRDTIRVLDGYDFEIRHDCYRKQSEEIQKSISLPKPPAETEETQNLQHATSHDAVPLQRLESEQAEFDFGLDGTSPQPEPAQVWETEPDGSEIGLAI